MARTALLVACLFFGFLALAAIPGCGADSESAPAPAPPPPSTARGADHYIKKYSAQELAKLTGDPDAKVDVKRIRPSGKNWLAEVEVNSRGQVTTRKVLLDSRGRILEER